MAEGLAANDRVKVRLSALQAARQHAEAPERSATDLAIESRAIGITPAGIAGLIGGARRVAAMGHRTCADACDAGT